MTMMMSMMLLDSNSRDSVVEELMKISQTTNQWVTTQVRDTLQWLQRLWEILIRVDMETQWKKSHQEKEGSMKL